MAKILLAEDDPLLAERISSWLKTDNHTVDVVDNGAEALDRLRFYAYELVILDWGLPQMDGIEVCQKFRSIGGQIPVLFLTARHTIADKTVGFTSGADDYLTKPFDVRELTLRVQALLRRPQEAQASILKVGNITVDTLSCKVTRDGEVIHLQRKEYALLEFLMRHPGHVFSAEALLDKVWSSDSEVSPTSIRSYVTKLRAKIEREGDDCIVKTVHGFGYKVE